MHAPIQLRLTLIALAVCSLGSAGCAGGWRPFQSQKKAVADREKYGPTADQRMATLTEDAKVAKTGTEFDQQEFTAKLAQSILEEHDPRVRSKMVMLSADFQTQQAIAICKGALQDPDERVRMAACTAWARRGGPEAVQMLATRYQTDSELDVRLRALRELGHLKTDEAIPVLAKALEDPDPAVQYRAVAALKEVSGRDLGNDVNAWREWAADPEGSGAEWSIAETFRKIF